MAFSQEFVIVDKAQHDLKKFSCGKPDMDTYLARFVVKNMQLGLSRIWVLPNDMFESFTDNPMRLFVSMNILKQIPAN